VFEEEVSTTEASLHFTLTSHCSCLFESNLTTLSGYYYSLSFAPCHPGLAYSTRLVGGFEEVEAHQDSAIEASGFLELRVGDMTTFNNRQPMQYLVTYFGEGE
jgi:hypothetical protein